MCITGRAYLRKGEGRSGGGAKSYDSEKAWPSLDHSILSVSSTRMYKQSTTGSDRRLHYSARMYRQCINICTFEDIADGQKYKYAYSTWKLEINDYYHWEVRHLIK